MTPHPDNIANNLTPLNHDTLYHLANTLNPTELNTWRATCRIADLTASHALNLRYLATLQTFVHNPTHLRNMLRITSSVISGSTALHILDVERGKNWTPTDLDIYTPHYSALQIVRYLCKVEHYHIHPNPAHYSYPISGFIAVFHLRRGDIKIDVIQSTTRSALHPLPYFWSTHVMNYLTADSFCIAYPEYTLHGKGLLNPIHLLDSVVPDRRIVANIQKYITRGYDFRARTTAWAADVDAPCDNPSACPRTIRFFGDKYCVIGSFTSHSDPSHYDRGLPDHDRTVRWWRGGPTCGGTCTHSYNAWERSKPKVQTCQLHHVLPSYILT
ncbi:hypothetical protein FKP32DRAFT_37151 [Trametes sanguinea]|nr:hypothetical protein FKP32DRAFT_37151 [Trametes sanguinea]